MVSMVTAMDSDIKTSKIVVSFLQLVRYTLKALEIQILSCSFQQCMVSCNQVHSHRLLYIPFRRREVFISMYMWHPGYTGMLYRDLVFN